MISRLNSFNDEIKKMRDQIWFIENVKSDIGPSGKCNAYVASMPKKVFDYSSLIISLYGIVERFANEFVFAYLENIESNIFSYDKVCGITTQNHFNFSIQLISKINENKYQKFNSLNKNDVLLNLSACISNKSKFKFNKEAFTINSGNLKHLKICDLFKGIGILNLDSELRKYEGFTLKTENLFNKIDDLVDRRNQIAHGSILDILNVSEIEPYIDFVEKYFSVINKIIQKKIIDEINAYKMLFSTLIENTQFYSSNLVGILNGKRYNLSTTNEILIKKQNSDLELSKILDVREYPPSDDITIKLEKPIKDNQEIYLFNEQKYIELKNIQPN